jgi:hypothetical protein
MNYRNLIVLSIFLLLVLPVAAASASVLYFNGTRSDQQVQLAWQTDSTSTARLFEIERSSDGKIFTQLGSIKVAAYGSQPYTYTDTKPLSGNLYYRLKITGQTGAASYSYVVSMRYFSPKDWSVFPSPMKRGQYLGIEINNTKTKAAYFEVRVSNMDGEFLYRQIFTALPGRTRNILNFYCRNAGVHVVELRDGNGTLAVRRVVVY